MHKIGVEVVAVDSEQADHARRAWRRFGKGRNPAGLNFADCFSYALALLTQEPLLFKGDDFSKTDIRAASSAAATTGWWRQGRIVEKFASTEATEEKIMYAAVH